MTEPTDAARPEAVARGATTPGGAIVGVREGRSGWDVVSWAPAGVPQPPALDGEAAEHDGGSLLVGPPSHDNAAELRRIVPWLRPRLVGEATSAGVGDRLGFATPGHVAAFRANPGILPVLAQQSARELGRTDRSFAEVVDAATFGALFAGWRDGYGADADHLKTLGDVDAGIAGGCTMFTADPIELVPDLPADAPDGAIAAAFEAIPWADLEDTADALAARYRGRFDLGDGTLALPAPAVRAAAARFGSAVVQVVRMYRHLADRLPEDAFEFEVAVDEIDHPTTATDHVYIATELRRLGVRWVSLAPRFVGEFEKGIDYLGDRDAFAADIALHARIARALGPYKLSVHSGSDKFSIYEVVADETRGLVHLKTSGTSYLAALRTLARTEPALVRRIWGVAIGAYTTARASYHVSANPGRVPEVSQVPDTSLERLLDEPDSREILHVTYGAVLRDGAGLGTEVRDAAWRHRDAYWAELAEHIGRHLRPFASRAGTAEEALS